MRINPYRSLFYAGSLYLRKDIAVYDIVHRVHVSNNDILFLLNGVHASAASLPTYLMETLSMAISEFFGAMIMCSLI